jgi:hypothetical protein
MEGRDIRASYEEDLNRLKEAQRNSAIAGLENTRNQALSNLQAERNQNAATYNAQRSSANAQNRLSARNFQEYLASTGRANSGLGAQARMQSANNLNTSINALNTGEAAALADINRRTTDAQNAYNTGLAGAQAQIEADYIKNLMEQRDKERQRELQERQFQESIRQFNENMALQRQQLQSRFTSGGGGGSSSGRRTSSGSSKSNQNVSFTDSPKQELSISEQNTASRNATKNKGVYVKLVQTKQGGIAEQLWKKNKNGKDTRVR